MKSHSLDRFLGQPLRNALSLVPAVLVLALAGGGLLQSQQATTPAATPPPATASEATAAASEVFSKEQLEQIIAPIALHPDPLLVQILMAATYPVEVVQAERWVKENSTLEGSALDEALKEQDWDASVKSLCKLPDVLKMMSENLDWTQDLGDAFLGQKDELMDTAQRMRGKAYDAGNLKTTEEIVVTVKQEPAQEKIIVIESPSPEVVYVPQYSPTVVYGSAWSYPSYYYPPMYYPPAYGYGLMTFGFGMAMGAAIWGDCNWGWGGNDINIDVDRYNNFNRNTNINADRTNLNNRSGNRQSWQHDASHRKGANYKNSGVAAQHGAGGASNRVARDQARGFSGSGTGATAGTRQARTPSATQNRAGQGTGTRSPVAGQGAGAGDRSATSSRPSSSGADRSSAASSRSSSSSPRSTTSRSSSGYGGSSRSSSAYSGSSRPSTDRMSSSRGSMSRGSSSYGGGGMSRGGGGMSRGGGGGGRRR